MRFQEVVDSPNVECSPVLYPEPYTPTMPVEIVSRKDVLRYRAGDLVDVVSDVNSRFLFAAEVVKRGKTCGRRGYWVVVDRSDSLIWIPVAMVRDSVPERSVPEIEIQTVRAGTAPQANVSARELPARNQWLCSCYLLANFAGENL